MDCSVGISGDEGLVVARFVIIKTTLRISMKMNTVTRMAWDEKKTRSNLRPIDLNLIV